MFPRLIPCLLLRNRGFVKTKQFKDPVYLGDPLNILKIFNEKEVDEIVILDILATKDEREPQFDYLSQLARECFMPLGYGGGITSVTQAEKIFKSGFEKVILNTSAVTHPHLIGEVAKIFGSQSVVASIDVKKGFFGKTRAYTHAGTKNTALDAVTLARRLEAQGAGEILINCIDRDGQMQGYDLELMKEVAGAVKVPVIGCGGAGSLDDMVDVIQKSGVSAAAAGSFFVFQGTHKAVLINAPPFSEVKKRLNLDRHSLHPKE